MSAKFPENFPPGTEARLRSIVVTTVKRLEAEIDNCDFPPGTGDDAASMAATQDVIVQDLFTNRLAKMDLLHRTITVMMVLSTVERMT